MGPWWWILMWTLNFHLVPPWGLHLKCLMWWNFRHDFKLVGILTLAFSSKCHSMAYHTSDIHHTVFTKHEQFKLSFRCEDLSVAYCLTVRTGKSSSCSDKDAVLETSPVGDPHSVWMFFHSDSNWGEAPDKWKTQLLMSGKAPICYFNVANAPFLYVFHFRPRRWNDLTARSAVCHSRLPRRSRSDAQLLDFSTFTVKHRKSASRAKSYSSAFF